MMRQVLASVVCRPVQSTAVSTVLVVPGDEMLYCMLSPLRSVGAPEWKCDVPALVDMIAHAGLKCSSR